MNTQISGIPKCVPHLYSSPNIRVVKSKSYDGRVMWHVREAVEVHSVLVGKSEWKETTWKTLVLTDIKTDLQETG